MSAGRKALEAIAERDGVVTPIAVVAEAESPDSPLHPYFVWDDTIAARRYRLDQARDLIRRYKFTVEVEPERVVRVRSYVSAPDVDGQRSYVPTADAMSDDAQRSFVLNQAIREVAALRAKYQALVDFDEVLRQSMRKEVAS